MTPHAATLPSPIALDQLAPAAPESARSIAAPARQSPDGAPTSGRADTRSPAVESQATDCAGEMEEIRSAMDSVLQRGDFILGLDVAQFEREFAACCGAAHAIGVASGTDALRMLLRVWGVGPGDEVITAGNAPMPAALAIAMTGATPVLVDPDPLTYTIDPAEVERAIGRRTRAVIAVHQYGRPADMQSLSQLARAVGVKLIEDASHAPGIEFHGRRCGGLADAAAFSLGPNKILAACGDAGAITTNDDELAERLRARRNLGSERPGVHPRPGCNSRLDTIQAAVLRVRLRRLTARLAARRSAAGRFEKLLLAIRGELLRTEPAATDGMSLPAATPGCGHAFYRYAVRVPRRDAIMKSLAARGIIAELPAVPIHRQPAFSNLPIRWLDLTRTERLFRELLLLS